MDQFAEARARNEKRLERIARSNANRPESVKKEEPNPQAERKSPDAMTLKISGPVEMTLLVDYAGTLTGGQQNEAFLRALFKKCLLPIGRVRDAA